MSLALAAATLAASPPAPAAAAPLTFTYEVRGKGNATSLEDFAARAAQTYADPRGWNLGGSIRFVRVARGGDFTLWLSAARYLPTFSSGCSTTYSCRVGRNVIINEARWNGSTPSYTAAGAPLRDYQHMVLNHETGHWLGFGHSYCSGNGQPAPVMQQQSKSLQGCRANAWPTAGERSTLARWRGVRIVTPPPPGPPPVAARTVVRIPAAGAPGTGVPAGAAAVGLNVTITQPRVGGYATLYPCGGPVPGTSNLNFAAGQTVAAFTVVQPGADGAVCLRASQAAHIIADVSGYVPAGSTYDPVPPRRLLDTRRTGGPVTDTVAVQLPAGTSAAALTVTVTEPAGRGHLTVFPCGTPKPLASTANFVTGLTVANFALAKAGADGQSVPASQLSCPSHRRPRRHLPGGLGVHGASAEAAARHPGCSRPQRHHPVADARPRRPCPQPHRHRGRRAGVGAGVPVWDRPAEHVQHQRGPRSDGGQRAAGRTRQRWSALRRGIRPDAHHRGRGGLLRHR